MPDTAHPTHAPDTSPWRTPANRSDHGRNVEPPEDSQVAEHQKALRTQPEGSDAGADEMAEQAVEPQPQQELSGVGGLAPMVDAGLVPPHATTNKSARA